MVCLAFIFYHILTFIRYIDVNFTFALTLWIVFVITIEDYVKARFLKSSFCSINFTVILAWLKKIVRYTKDFVKSSFCSINFTVILAWLKKIVRYTKDFVMFLKSPFGEVTIKYVCMYMYVPL